MGGGGFWRGEIDVHEDVSGRRDERGLGEVVMLNH
jgi:hypothetical protein